LVNIQIPTTIMIPPVAMIISGDRNLSPNPTIKKSGIRIA
jgi:hypothetical protein